MGTKKIIHEHEPEIVSGLRKAKKCPQCHRWFSMAASHAERHTWCSAECRRLASAAIKESRERDCRHCGKRFAPKAHQLKIGNGRYCSNECAKFVRLASTRTPEATEKRIASFKRQMAICPPPRGAASPHWKGGRQASACRQWKSGTRRESSYRWRAANRERVREYWHRYRGKREQDTRMPYGSIPKLLALQRRKCAYCRTAIPPYHVDHIEPIHLGGKHEWGNLQLLCPTCNVRKWATPPEQYAQKIGLLL